jgi:hypothetical protein
MIVLLVGLLGLIGFFTYSVRPHANPCDSIFEQTAPKLGVSLEYLKLHGGLVIGDEKIQGLAESSQRVGILCKTCCIESQTNKINAQQFQSCLNTTKQYQTQIVRVADSVATASAATERGDRQLAAQKAEEAITDASKAATTVTSLAAVANSVSSPPSAAAGEVKSPDFNPPPKAVMITQNDGTAVWVNEGSLGFGPRSEGLLLESGQSVDFSKIKAIDVLAHDDKENKEKLRITLVDGRTIEAMTNWCSGYSAGGDNDLGRVEVPCEKVKRIVFRR